MKAADIIGLMCIFYLLFILTPLLSMHVTHTAHLFSPVLIIVELLMIKVFDDEL